PKMPHFRKLLWLVASEKGGLVRTQTFRRGQAETMVLALNEPLTDLTGGHDVPRHLTSSAGMPSELRKRHGVPPIEGRSVTFGHHVCVSSRHTPWTIHGNP